MPGGHRPLIAISATIEPWPPSQTELHCTRLAIAYSEAVYRSGGRPVILPVTADPPSDLLAGISGLILAGGGDIDPARYGAVAESTVYGVRPDRDAFEAALYQEALARRLPILAICRGLQLVNVLRGGTLIQHLDSDPPHWQGAPPAASSHEVTVAPDSFLAELVGPAGVAEVNSYHHQAVADLGAGLRVTARCGPVVEALEALDADVVAVQWHPEQMAATDPLSAALFATFVARAAVRSAGSPSRSAPDSAPGAAASAPPIRGRGP
jgi:putative glutamine amidotransferase